MHPKKLNRSDLSDGDVARFESHVDRLGEGDCWPWKMYCFPFGYGAFKFARRSVVAHRVAWVLKMGSVGNECVLHRCDNPRCCNPSHLFLGSKSDNSADMVGKGRHARGDRHAVRKNPSLVTGERNPRAKMSIGDVQEMRVAYAFGGVTMKQLAAKFGVSPAQAHRIISGRQWRS